jgi:radical SAM protein with 4Fe4S-binding SPASM domain
MAHPHSVAELATNFRPPPRVRYNAEDFGFIVGFPDGEIVLAGPEAVHLLNPGTERGSLDPHLLEHLTVPDGFHLRTPPLVWLELTRKCNLTCEHCYIDAGHARAREMSTERWIELIDEMANMGVWAVAFTGGEPTLHKDFAKLVKHSRSRDLLVGIATHGMFLTNELLAELPREGVIVSVSIDDLHTGPRGAPDPTSAAKASIIRAQEYGFLTNVMANTHRRNIDKLEDLIQWATDHGTSVRSVPMSPIGRGKLHPYLENTVEDVPKAAEFWMKECEWEHEYHTHAGLCVGSIFNYGLSLAYMTRRCSSGRYLCYVAADGTVFPCTMCAGEDIFASGSVAGRSFADVWRSDWPIRERSWSDFAAECEGCPINDDEFYCASRCPAMSHARHGRLDKCGASPFEIASAEYRTKMLNRTATGRSSNIFVRPAAAKETS